MQNDKHKNVFTTPARISAQALASLRQEMAQVARILLATPMGVTLSSIDGVIFEVNAAFAEMLGYSVEECMGGTIMGFTHPEDREMSLDNIRDIFESKTDSFRIEKRYIKKDGTTIWGHTTCTVERDENGEPKCFFGITEDITEKRRSRKELETSEERFKNIAETLPNLVWTTSNSGDLEYYNAAWLEYTGAELTSDRKWTWLDFIHPDDRAHVLEKWTAAKSGGSLYESEFRMKRFRDGQYRWFVSRGTPVYDDHGALVRWYGSNSDIHDQKIAQLDFEKKVDTSPAILWITGPDGSCSYLSKQWYSYTGQTQAEGEGFGWLDATHPDDKERAGRDFVEANSKQGPFYTEYRLRTADGSYRWAIDAANPRFGPGGEYLGYAGTVFDIHERKKAEVELHALQERFERSARATDLGVWYCDLPFSFLIWNKEVKDHFFVHENAQVTIHDFYDHIHPEDREKVRAAINFSINNQAPYDVIARTWDTVDLSVQKSIRCIGWTDYNESGEPIRFDGITLDVTDELRQQSDLQKAKDEADRANELKSAFLANMSHEIRTPLGAMLGFADLLRDPSLGAAEKLSYVDTIIRNGEQLSVIINDILDLSKVEAGHLTLEYTTISPASLASDVVSLLKVKAKEKGLSLSFELDASTPEFVVTDSTRVRQVLFNLVGNAIKFTKAGSVQIRTYGVTSPTGRHCARFEVEDTGMGIPPSQTDRIFEIFVQADGSMTRRFGGTGLGLALSRSLARALGGDVTVIKSEVDQGSTFQFTIEDLPERQTHPPDLLARPPAALALGEKTLEGLRALIVDDAPDNRHLIGRYLAKQGAEVTTRDNGLDGFTTALAGTFDIVLMDIQMPVMDGYTATQKLRDTGYRGPIVAPTAHAMNEVRMKCLAVGFSDYLSKPIDQKELIATIRRLTAP